VIATLTGHFGSVYAVGWSPDGTHLAAGGSDGVRVWDPVAGVVVAYLVGHGGSVHAVAWSPDGARLAAAGTSEMVRVWDPVACVAIAAITGHAGSVYAVEWSPDGTCLATAGADGIVRLTNVTDPEFRRSGRKYVPVRLFRRSREGISVPVGEPVGEPSDSIESLAYSPDGSTIATCHRSGYVELRSVGPGSAEPVVRVMDLGQSGWAVLYGEHRYRLQGDPEGRFWWTVGLCRFEPGELDGYGTERL
jgi:WD40 repeat protein